VPTEPPVLSFSGGVADCIETEHPALAFGDLGPILGQSIRKSRLCQGEYRLGEETIRATVIGAGSHSTQLSGSTVFYRNIPFPMKNLPVVGSISALSALDGPGVLALPGVQGANYAQITAMADEIASDWPDQPIFIALQADMAKALGNALALRLPKQRPILCIDRVHLDENSYLDVGLPVDHAIPVVVKTLILNR
jgi:ethanolamine utilization protein EutA